MSLIESFARRVKQINFIFTPPPQLRREHERFAVTAALEIELEGAIAAHTATDISHGGAFVEPPIMADAGTAVLVSVGDLFRGARATVVAHRGSGTALKFDSAVHGAALTAWLVSRNTHN